MTFSEKQTGVSGAGVAEGIGRKGNLGVGVELFCVLTVVVIILLGYAFVKTQELYSKRGGLTVCKL